ncbi:lysophospholipid acyltransferase family protein [Roseinatronobacter alkalisoli]|uniref:Lysophospholipid acyltransferase family protein n=1 Tax=Roseinatronobacter alkalisoli TaxID=3028235 RepID=A0ABT5T4Y3_9RHOB|nr:lysophospholipid acyltransferase family protein [Roseinatronobacter sp. HJB301]MDD7970182.1 lysophospholipid acyltransferase family protein [Roseinatronobacter sp. HJB301]
MTWGADLPPPATRLRWRDWPRITLRLCLLVPLLFGGLGVLLILRLLERPVFGLRRPFTPYLTQNVCRMALLILGLRLKHHGQPMTARGAVVANHASWLDIFVLNAADRVYFVAKAEVARWAGIGWLARATGTVFIRRDRRDAARQKLLFEARLRAGHRLLFFPEGTSSDGLRVLPFKSTLFEAFFAPELQDFLYIQPVTIAYHPAAGQERHLYGWWGDMDFGGHLLYILAQSQRGHVDLVFHPALRVAEFPDRKHLSMAAEHAVKEGFDRAHKGQLPLVG